MNFFKKNIRTIIGCIVGVILASSITVYAYSYIASDVKYTKKDGTEVSVESALNELYDKSKNYILPVGTLDINSNGENIDVKQYEKVNVNVENTEQRWNTGYGTLQNETFTISNLGFRPSFVMVFYSQGWRKDWGQMFYYSATKNKYIGLFGTDWTYYSDTIPSGAITVTDGGFVFCDQDGSNWNGAQYYWVAAK